MKLTLITLFTGVLMVSVDGAHTFIGTNVQRPLVMFKEVSYSSKLFQKRVEYFNYTLPNLSSMHGRYIQGILAYDLNNSGAPANVTAGGIGTSFVNLRMKSDRGKSLKYQIYIYA